VYAFPIRIWQKLKIMIRENAATLYGNAAFCISTRFPINLPLTIVFVVEAPELMRVRFFNVKIKRYLSFSASRSPPSVLVSTKKLKRRLKE
jgi:hypothetical protein